MNRSIFLSTGIVAAAAVAFGLVVGRGQARQDAAPAIRVAVVDVFAVVSSILAQEDVAQERTDVSEKYTALMTPVEEQINALLEQGSALAPSDPAIPALQQQFNALNEQALGIRQQWMDELRELTAQQSVAAYQQIVAETEAVAADGGYSHVFVTRRGSDLLADVGDLGVISDEFMSRPIVVYPESDDLTDQVMERLGVQDVIAPPVMFNDPNAGRPVSPMPSGPQP